MSEEIHRDNEFILDDLDYKHEDQTPGDSGANFFIVPHLAVIAIILFALFSTIAVPKILALFEPAIDSPEVIVVKDVASVTTSVSPFTGIATQAKAVYVFDISNQTVLYEKNSDEVLPLASITKLMTALLSYELVDDDTEVTVSTQASRQESGGGFRSGEIFKAKELADFALTTSFNSAAYTLADAVGRKLGTKDPVDQFVLGMNLEAEELGMTSLEFKNPTGLDISTVEAGAYGSAKDVSRLVEHIWLKYPEILLPTLQTHTRLYNKSGNYHESDNTNDIITNIPNLLGSKTGYTDLAGGNLTVIFDAGYNRPIVISVMGSSRNGRFEDMEKLIKASLTAVSVN